MSFGSAYLTLPDFQYHRPSSVEEVVALLKQHGDEAKIMAGGVGMIAFMKERLMSPAHLIDVKGVDALKRVQQLQGRGMRIGAAVTYSELGSNEALKKEYPILHEVVRKTADPMIRARATLVGNVCEAIPWIDSAPALIALEAALEIVGPNGRRSVSVEEFIRGPVDIDLRSDEFVTAVELPERNASARGAFEKFTAGSEFSVASVAVALLPGKGARVVFGSVNSTPIRSREAEKVIAGGELSRTIVRKAARAASEEVDCVSDVLATSGYRKHLVEVLASRALGRLVRR
ncbi:MAG: xanthine dehydrogenase family protein subunit M [Nitrososphaerota archaeon]|nr:xanthine dehydrogenase family protein subunit M [Nitrososphaerota archaeon]